MLLMKGLAHFTKQRLLLPNAEVLRRSNPKGFEAVVEATSMQGVYDLCMKHFSGYTGKAEAYAEACLNPFHDGPGPLRHVKVPLLWVVVEDDPVAPGGPPAEWLDTMRHMQYASMAMFRYGSHCACYDSLSLSKWVDKLLLEWLDAHTDEKLCVEPQQQM